MKYKLPVIIIYLNPLLFESESIVEIKTILISLPNTHTTASEINSFHKSNH